jgi:hypothetical protein
MNTCKVRNGYIKTIFYLSSSILTDFRKMQSDLKNLALPGLSTAVPAVVNAKLMKGVSDDVNKIL